jgi:hypothetical protein
MKLFDNVKSWLGIKPKGELVEETRVISSANSEVTSITIHPGLTKAVLSYLISDAIKHNRIKGYKNLLKFTEKYPCSYLPNTDIDNIIFTIDDEVAKLCKTMMMLGYKSEDKYMKSMIRWGKRFFDNNDDIKFVSMKD